MDTIGTNQLLKIMATLCHKMHSSHREDHQVIQLKFHIIHKCLSSSRHIIHNFRKITSRFTQQWGLVIYQEPASLFQLSILLFKTQVYMEQYFSQSKTQVESLMLADQNPIQLLGVTHQFWAQEAQKDKSPSALLSLRISRLNYSSSQLDHKGEERKIFRSTI